MVPYEIWDHVIFTLPIRREEFHKNRRAKKLIPIMLLDYCEQRNGIG
jgi:hypothetical protein